MLICLLDTGAHGHCSLQFLEEKKKEKNTGCFLDLCLQPNVGRIYWIISQKALVDCRETARTSSKVFLTQCWRNVYSLSSSPFTGHSACLHGVKAEKFTSNRGKNPYWIQFRFFWYKFRSVTWFFRKTTKSIYFRFFTFLTVLPVLEALSVWRLSEATEFEGQERLPVTDNVGRAFIKKRCDLKKTASKQLALLWQWLWEEETKREK